MTRLGSLLCALRGHDAVIEFEDGVMRQRCTSCGHRSPGIAPVGRPRQTYAGDPEHHALRTLRLIRPATERRQA